MPSNGTATQQQEGQQLPELPRFDPAGKNLNDYATYVRKLTAGGTQDFQAPLGTLLAPVQGGGGTLVATNKQMLRSFNPQTVNLMAFCLGGTIKNDNKGGIYYSERSSDQDNDGDRIRPNNYQGFVWFKWLI